MWNCRKLFCYFHFLFWGMTPRPFTIILPPPPCILACMLPLVTKVSCDLILICDSTNLHAVCCSSDNKQASAWEDSNVGGLFPSLPIPEYTFTRSDSTVSQVTPPEFSLCELWAQVSGRRIKSTLHCQPTIRRRKCIRWHCSQGGLWLQIEVLKGM